MRLVLTGGGTGGHVSPQLALIEYISDARNQVPGARAEILYIGHKDGIEARLIPEANIDFVGIAAGKLRRYFTLRNIFTPFEVLAGYFKARQLLRSFRPDVIFSSGGFVSVPVVLAAARQKIPIVIHEQTTVLGLANKISARYAAKILLSYAGVATEYPRDKIYVTGNPVRSRVLAGDKKTGLELLDFTDRLPIVLVMGGAQGAQFLNLLVEQTLSQWLTFCQLIIVTGEGESSKLAAFYCLRQQRDHLSVEEKKRLRLFTYVNKELAHIYAVTDLYIGRAGAGTIAEILALRKPSILIPLPQSAAGEQDKNARMMERLGGAVVFDQKGLEQNYVPLMDKAKQLTSDETLLADMTERLSKSDRQQAVEKVWQQILGARV